MSLPSLSRRRFLRQSFGFSAAALLSAGIGCGSGDVEATTADDPNVNPDPAHLLMLGDYGEELNPPTHQQAVADGMKAFVTRHQVETDALLMLGDNLYGDLPGGANDPRWQTQFEDMYPASTFNCSAYAVPGNHDYELRPASKYLAELAYAQKGTSRWKMPARHYTFMFPKTQPVMKVIALDSNMPFTDGATTHGTFYAMTEQQRMEQLTWLQTELAAPRTVPFLAVMAHHPIYSDGPHGDHSILTRDWDPLFRQYKVDIYMAGHDHDMQHLEFSGHPTSFVMSGGGGAPLYNLRTPPNDRGPYAQKVYGFSHMRVTDKQFTFRHLDTNGNLLHKFTKTADGTVTIL